MSLLTPLLRPVAIRQGQRLVAPLPELPSPSDAPHGVVAGPGSGRHHVVVLGDELATAVGTDSLADGLPGTLATRLANDPRWGGEVVWQVVSEPGVGMEEVHHRMLDQVAPSADVVALMVGLNDLMARTSVADWARQLESVLDLLTRQAGRAVVVIGCPPLHHAPLLGWPLTDALANDAGRFDRESDRLSEVYGALFVPWRDLGTSADGWLPDGFHPAQSQYRALADGVDLEHVAARRDTEG